MRLYLHFNSAASFVTALFIFFPIKEDIKVICSSGLINFSFEGFIYTFISFTFLKWINRIFKSIIKIFIIRNGSSFFWCSNRICTKSTSTRTCIIYTFLSSFQMYRYSIAYQIDSFQNALKSKIMVFVRNLRCSSDAYLTLIKTTFIYGIPLMDKSWCYP